MRQKPIQTILLAGSMLAYVMLPCISQAEVVQNTPQPTSSTVNTPQQATIPATGTIRYFYAGSTLMNAEDDNGNMSTYLSRTIRTIVNVNTQTVVDTQCLFTDGKNVISQTDSTGTTITSTQQYNAYGQPVNYNSDTDSKIPKSTNQPLSIATNPFQYDGYYYDSESGLYYLNARYYSPALMQFISMDTYDLANRYGYCNGNPIGNEDPTGHSALQLVASGLALIGMMLAAFTPGAIALASYMGSNIAYSLGQLVAAGENKNWTSFTGNMLFLVAGVIGASGAIPKTFAELDDNNIFIKTLKVFNNPDKEEIPAKIIDENGRITNLGDRIKWVQDRTKFPSKATGVLGGLGAGIANAPHTNNEDYNMEMMGLYAVIGGAAGYASGHIYGSFNMKTPTKLAIGTSVENALIKSGVSGLIVGAASAGEQSNNVFGHDGSHDDGLSYYLGIGGDTVSPFILGAASGASQNFQQFGGRPILSGLLRYGYLDLKTNYVGQIFSIGPAGLANNLNPTNGAV